MIALMPKPAIHPTWYPHAKVYLDGQLLLKVGATKPKLEVDIWSGTHPAYTGRTEELDTEGRAKRFLRRYGWEEASLTDATIDADDSTTS
mmetsp:Transcript_70923/g.135249  ORF Transcript_70923/g.135249 Transcript_70923/m.135249 type:complete len:90 (+) Transcript_70923:84-353(+)